MPESDLPVLGCTNNLSSSCDVEQDMKGEARLQCIRLPGQKEKDGRGATTCGPQLSQQDCHQVKLRTMEAPRQRSPNEQDP